MLDFVWAKGRLLFMAGIAVLVIAFGAAACGDDDDDDDDDDTDVTEEEEEPADDDEEPSGGAIDFGSLSGSIAIDGSSTVFPVTEAVAEEFASVAPDVQVTVGFSGTGGGFELLCAGEIDIADASRPFEEGAEGDCPEGIAGLTEIQVGIDALTVVVNPDNDFVDCLTFEQLAQIFGDGGASTWADVNPDWPAEPIVHYYPGTDSGTFDFFVETILGAPDEGGTPHTGEGTASEDDNILALGVEEDEFAIGYFGYAYYSGAGESLRAVPVDAGEGCVEPTDETALDGSYPLSRPLFIYTSGVALEESPQTVGFIQFYLDNISLVGEQGYVAVPDDILAEQQAKIDPFLP